MNDNQDSKPKDCQKLVVSVPNRMIIFIDARNIKSSQENYNTQNGDNFVFGYKEMMDFFNSKFDVIRGYFYDGAPHESQQTFDRKGFYNEIRNLGITLRLKEINLKNPNASQKGVDIFLTSDMISLAYENAYDIAVILSGDGDYTALIDLVKSKGKKVWVLSFQNSLSHNLRNCADKVILIDRMLSTFRKSHIDNKKIIKPPVAIPDKKIPPIISK